MEAPGERGLTFKSDDMGFLASCLAREFPSKKNDLEWDYLVRLASAQGLAGLMLNSVAARSAPDRVTNALRAASAQVAGKNLHSVQELARVAGAFQTAGIPLMALKGAALNLTVYSRPDLRPLSDLDLLVAPQHANDAVTQLQSMGYEPGVSLIRDDFFPAHHYEKEMILPGPRPVRIDLHAHPWRPMHLAQVVTSHSFWAGAVPVPLGTTSILIPRPETMLIHLAAHAAFHGYSRFIWLYDLKRVSEHYAGTLDWDRVVDSAKVWHLPLAVQKAIHRAQSLFGEFCPAHVARELADPGGRWRDRLVIWHTPRDEAFPLLHVACNMICLRGLGAKLSYLAAMLAPSAGHLGQVYPYRHAGWTACAHVWRSLRMMGRALVAPFSFLRTPIHAFQAQGGLC